MIGNTFHRATQHKLRSENRFDWHKADRKRGDRILLR
jgi:hypothetical protein